MVHHTGARPDPSRDTGHAMVVENREESSGESGFGAERVTRPPARPPARRNPRDSRNIAVALALLAFAVIMFLVTIVKFDEQIQSIGVSQTRGATTPTRVRTWYPGSGVAAVFPTSDARAWGTAANPGRFGDSKAMVADFDRGGDRADHGDVGGVAVAAGPRSGRPEESVGAIYVGIAGT